MQREKNLRAVAAAGGGGGDTSVFEVTWELKHHALCRVREDEGLSSQDAWADAIVEVGRPLNPRAVHCLN